MTERWDAAGKGCAVGPSVPRCLGKLEPHSRAVGPRLHDMEFAAGRANTPGGKPQSLPLAMFEWSFGFTAEGLLYVHRHTGA